MIDAAALQDATAELLRDAPPPEWLHTPQGSFHYPRPGSHGGRRGMRALLQSTWRVIPREAWEPGPWLPHRECIAAMMARALPLVSHISVESYRDVHETLTCDVGAELRFDERAGRTFVVCVCTRAGR